MESKEPAHIIFACGALWSHVIANMQTGVRILQASPSTLLTFVGTGEDADMTKMVNIFNKSATTRLRHVLNQYSQIAKDVRDRIQILDVGPGKGTDPSKNGVPWEEPKGLDGPKLILDGFEWAWLDLCGPASGKGLGSRWTAPPTVWMSDINVYEISLIMDSLAQTHGTPLVPGIMSSGIASTTLLRYFVPEETFGGISGAGGLRERFNKCLADGMDPVAATNKALFNDQGRLMHFEDMPPMYDYEFRPQSAATIFPPPFIDLMEKIGKWDAIPHALMDYGVPEFEPYATKELGNQLDKVGKKHFPIGYGLTRAEFESQNPVTRVQDGSLNEEEKKVLGFLDKMKAEHGPQSVAYICFGSIVWPSERPEMIEHIVDGLLEAVSPIPFLWSVSSVMPSVQVPDKAKEKASNTGLGMFVNWVPQMSVLQHDAVRFFISHCGAGSMIESLYAGIPIVAVPFVNDEAFIARQLVGHKAAIQLHQLNSGMKGRPLGHGVTVTEDPKDIRAEMEAVYGTLRDPKQYEEYRGNVRNLSQLLENSVRSGASARALESFVNTYLRA